MKLVCYFCSYCQIKIYFPYLHLIYFAFLHWFYHLSIFYNVSENINPYLKINVLVFYSYVCFLSFLCPLLYSPLISHKISSSYFNIYYEYFFLFQIKHLFTKSQVMVAKYFCFLQRKINN